MAVNYDIHNLCRGCQYRYPKFVRVCLDATCRAHLRPLRTEPRQKHGHWGEHEESRLMIVVSVR